MSARPGPAVGRWRTAIERWQQRSFLIGQCALTAGPAWWLAQVVLGHPVPFFAAIAAILCLGLSFGHRLRRSLEVAAGVALGVGVGELFVRFFGTGVWQIVLAVALAMSFATLIGAGQLMIIQAGVQSLVVTTLLPDPGQGFGRWLDAVFGCALALVVATVAPSAPLRRPGYLAAQILEDMSGTLRDAVRALKAVESAAAEEVLVRARAAGKRLAALTDAGDEGLALVRHSPFRRGQLSEVRKYAQLAGPLDRANRNLRVLARRCAVATWRGEKAPPDYLDVVSSTADVMSFMASELYAGRLPRAARSRLTEAAHQSAQLHVQGSRSAVVILAQSESIMVDLMELTGMTYVEARALLFDVA